jgi:hypothetical protein
MVLLLMVVPVSADYVLPIQALTNSPADSVTNYLGNRPAAPTTTANVSVQIIPTAGTINVAEIYDYSGTAGTNQAYSYYIRVNNANDYLIATLSVATNERVFSNTSMGIAVNAGDYIEIKRVHPVWATNPLTNIVGGYVKVDTSADRGYNLFAQALTNTPADNVKNYIGSLPSAPSTTEGIDNIYLPTNGLLTQAHISEYSGTAGTAEAYSYYINVNGTSELIQTQAVSANGRFFDNNALSIPVYTGTLLQINRTHPAWATNPATNIVGGTIFINTTDESTANGYSIRVEGLTNTPADGATVYFGSKPSAPSGTAGQDKIYIRQDGTITVANVYSYSGTAGTAEPWSMYVRKNNTEDYLIDTVSLNTKDRLWRNTTIDIQVSAGDYIEIKSVQPTFVTNPATTIYGGYIYLMYDGAPPVPSFTASNVSGFPPTIVTVTDTSETDITSRVWTAENTINSTTITFGAGASPTTIELDTGHWYIRETVTNASETRTSDPILIPVNPSGGYTGFVQQDAWQVGAYLIRFTLNDADGNMLSNVTILSSTGQTNTTSITGIGEITEDFGSATVTFSKDGYYSRIISYVFDSDADYTVTLTTAAPVASPNTNTLYSPIPVQLKIVDSYGAPQPGAFVDVRYISSSLPSDDIGWLTNNFGINSEIAEDMLNSSTAEADYTGQDGGFTFAALSVIRYNITITNATTGINHRVELSPKDTHYTIYCPLANQMKTNNTIGARLNSTLPWYSLNNTHISLAMTYQDMTACTSSVKFRVWFRINGSEVHNTTWSDPGTTLILDNHTVPKAPIGTEYLWQYNATQVC